MKKYIGRRKETGECEVWVLIGESIPGDKIRWHSKKLACRFDLANHSLTGFEWGYGGSGPAQLALAILADAYCPDFALKHYQEFKWKVVSHFAHDGFAYHVEELERFIRKERLK